MAGPRRVACALLTAALALAGAGCAAPGTSAPAAAAVWQDEAFATPAEPPDPAAIFALDPAMRAFLDAEIAPRVRRAGALRALLDALQSHAALQLDYDAARTRTAAEAFERRAGNCLSLVVMTAAFARELGLPIGYQALLGHQTWSRQAGLTVINGHVNITVGKRLVDRESIFDHGARIRVNFDPLPPGREKALRTIGEATIVTMFLNNRAAELLGQGDLDSAYAHAREALLHDVRFAPVYNTLGVIYERRGRTEAAERAYRAALALEDDQRSALGNLARLLAAQHRVGGAAVLHERLARLEQDAPFAHFDRAVAAARAGDYRTARDELRIEMRRDPDYHEFHHWMAVAMAGLGDTAAARRHLQAAIESSLTLRSRDLYAAKLRALAAAPAGRSGSDPTVQ